MVKQEDADEKVFLNTGPNIGKIPTLK